MFTTRGILLSKERIAGKPPAGKDEGMQIILLRVGGQTTALIAALGAAATLLFTAANGRWAIYQIDTSVGDMDTIRKNAGSSYIASVFAQLP